MDTMLQVLTGYCTCQVESLTLNPQLNYKARLVFIYDPERIEIQVIPRPNLLTRITLTRVDRTAVFIFTPTIGEKKILHTNNLAFFLQRYT